MSSLIILPGREEVIDLRRRPFTSDFQVQVLESETTGSWHSVFKDGLVTIAWDEAHVVDHFPNLRADEGNFHSDDLAILEG